MALFIKELNKNLYVLRDDYDTILPSGIYMSIPFEVHTFLDWIGIIVTIMTTLAAIIGSANIIIQRWEGLMQNQIVLFILMIIIPIIILVIIFPLTKDINGGENLERNNHHTSTQLS